MSVAMSPAGAQHLQHCPRDQNCRCTPAYAVNTSGEYSDRSLQVGYASGMHYAQAPPALDTTGPPNPSTYTGHYQAYTSQNAPLPFGAPQARASVAADMFDGSAAQMPAQALPAATAIYNQPTPMTTAQAYPSYYTHNLNNSQWEAVGGPGAGAAVIQEAPLAVAPVAMVATAQSTRINVVPGEEGVYEIVIRVRL